jgi:predicted hotdog family 3-hydroxylacyl-ACP dehydratase
MLIAKAAIRRLIPHAGTMCLLDGVTAWDATSIVCVTATHRDTANPLRRQGRLAGLHAFEYGAQAAAIHGSLVASAAGRQVQPAYLAALRDARLYVTRLDDIAVPLAVTAQRLAGEGGNCIYQVSVSADATVLAHGRIIIINRPEIIT